MHRVQLKHDTGSHLKKEQSAKKRLKKEREKASVWVCLENAQRLTGGVVCCVRVISSSGAPTFATTESVWCVAVCACVCVRRKLSNITGKYVVWI